MVKERARQSFVLLAEVEDLGDSIRVPYDRERVKNAPDMRAEGALSQDKEAALFRYYGLDYSVTRSGLPAGAAGEDVDQRRDMRDTAVGRDLSGPTTDDAMTRSEKEFRVGTTERERGRMRCAST